MKAGFGSVVTDAGLDLEQVDVYCEKIAEFIRPRKDIQQVVISKNEDD